MREVFLAGNMCERNALFYREMGKLSYNIYTPSLARMRLQLICGMSSVCARA